MSRRLAWACVGLAGCQIAAPAAREQRLPALKSPVPLLALPSYVPAARELLPAELTSGEREMTGTAVFALAPDALLPHHSYHLRFRARASRSPARVAVKFREPKRNDSFRTFGVSVTESTLRDYRLDFTAPAYTRQAELTVEAANAQLEFTAASLVERDPIPVTEPIASAVGSYVPAGYALVFNDEFNGAALNRQKWFTRYIYSSETLDRLNDENQRYTDDGTQRVAGGVLYLTAKKQKLSRVSGVNYESGMIRSDFTLRYGFLEARVKMPGGLGVWPAFWLNSDVSEDGKLSHPPEIDIFEFVNNGKDDRVNQLHSAATKNPNEALTFAYEHPNFRPSIQSYRAPFNFNEGFHTVGAEWTPDTLTLYVDGLKIYTRAFRWIYRDGSLAGPAHILLNLAIGGQWAGRYGIDDAAFPQALAIDWVRAYQKPAPAAP
jgi:beta-glucanase (GH16 family)